MLIKMFVTFDHVASTYGVPDLTAQSQRSWQQMHDKIFAANNLDHVRLVVPQLASSAFTYCIVLRLST